MKMCAGIQNLLLVETLKAGLRWYYLLWDHAYLIEGHRKVLLALSKVTHLDFELCIHFILFLICRFSKSHIVIIYSPS